MNSLDTTDKAANNTPKGSQGHLPLPAPVLIVIAGICWGAIGLFSNPLSDGGLTALQITALRCLFSAIALILFLLFTGNKSLLRIRLKDLYLFIGTGIGSIVFFNICYFLCIQLSTLSVACILLYTAPGFVLAMSCLFFREKFTLNKGISLLLALAGCVCVTGILGNGSLSLTPAAFLIGLGSGFGYALYSIIGRIALRRYNWLTVITYTFIVGAIALIPFAQPSKMAGAVLSGPALLLSAFLLGLVSTVTPFLLYTKGLEHMETSKASLLTFVEPLVATLISIFIFREPFTAFNLTGMLLIMASIVIGSR